MSPRMRGDLHVGLNRVPRALSHEISAQHLLSIGLHPLGTQETSQAAPAGDTGAAMNMAAVQDGEVGQLQELGCPWLAKLYPALLATKSVQEKLRAFGSKTVVLHGQFKHLPDTQQPQNRQHLKARQAGHKVHHDYNAGSIPEVASSALQPAMEWSYTWPTFQTLACLLWHLRSAACILYCRHDECAAASVVVQASAASLHTPLHHGHLARRQPYCLCATER